METRTDTAEGLTCSTSAGFCLYGLKKEANWTEEHGRSCSVNEGHLREEREEGRET